MDVIAAEFSLTNVQADKLLETIGEATVGEVLALALTMGPTWFVAGPLALLVDVVTSGDLITFYSYLVLAQGQLRSLTRWGHLMNSNDQQNYSAQLERLCASIQHWLYSTLVFASGLFVGVDQSQPLHSSERQIPWEMAGFPMPQQLADLTLAEVEDFVATMAAVLAQSSAQLVCAGTQLSPSREQYRCIWYPSAPIFKDAPRRPTRALYRPY